MNCRKQVMLFTLVLTVAAGGLQAQGSYRYEVDLTRADNDRLQVSLLTPTVKEKEITFYFPKIVPGTYMNSNYGKYINNLKATDKNGKALPVSKKGDNAWVIKNAAALHKITYEAEDTWDATIDNKVYPMAGTNFEAGKNFVINTPGLFGYLDGMKKTPFELNFTKPNGFYGATGLKAVSATDTKDVYRVANADELYDSPIMFSLPDTTIIRAGNADILVAVYSPKKLATSKFIAANLEKLMLGTKDYLGGKLPVDKYAFIFYFNGEQKPLENSGAWEHSYSSFYAMPEAPQEQAIGQWVDIAAHEFFHIVTPLNISSKEVREFNFNETVLSRHLWLYEGSTEYDAHHMQVWAGLNSPEEFLEKMAQKIMYSRGYLKDDLSFTDLSLQSAGKWKDEYMNVYMKGALISACIDLKLLEQSDGQYSLRNLKHDLGVKFGKENYFKDEELFDIIGQLTWPVVKDFLVKYVQGGTPIPYQEYFGLAGVDYIPEEKQARITFGDISVQPGQGGRLIVNTQRMNDFGKALGYKDGDELVSLNGEPITMGNANELIGKFYEQTREGDVVKVGVNRKGEDGNVSLITLSAPAKKVETTIRHQLKINPNPTPAQLKIRQAWWGQCNAGK